MNSIKSDARKELAQLTRYQQVLLTQLPQVVQRAEHIDELLLWLGQACIQFFGVEVTQFWVHHQRLRRGDPSLELRLMTFRYPTLPQQAVVNPSVAGVVERVMRDRRGVMPQQVQATFDPPVVQQLLTQRLQYWSCYFLSQNALLPAARNQNGNMQSLTPLTMAVSLFFQEQPHPRLLPLISHLMEQAMGIAKQARLLTSSQ